MLLYVIAILRIPFAEGLSELQNITALTLSQTIFWEFYKKFSL